MPTMLPILIIYYHHRLPNLLVPTATIVMLHARPKLQHSPQLWNANHLPIRGCIEVGATSFDLVRHHVHRPTNYKLHCFYHIIVL